MIQDIAFVESSGVSEISVETLNKVESDGLSWKSIRNLHRKLN